MFVTSGTAEEATHRELGGCRLAPAGPTPSGVRTPGVRGGRGPAPRPPGRDPAASDSTRGQLWIRGADSPARGLRQEDEDEESHAAPAGRGVRPRLAAGVALHGP